MTSSSSWRHCSAQEISGSWKSYDFTPPNFFGLLLYYNFKLIVQSFIMHALQCNYGYQPHHSSRNWYLFYTGCKILLPTYNTWDVMTPWKRFPHYWPLWGELWREAIRNQWFIHKCDNFAELWCFLGCLPEHQETTYAKMKFPLKF